MVSEVHEALREVDRPDALRRQRGRARDELVFSEAAEGHVEHALEPVPHVVRVQHGPVGDLPEAVAAHPQDVGVRADEEGEVAVPRADLADRLRPIVVEVVPASIQGDEGDREERLERLLHPDGTRSGPAASVRRREGLVEVEMDNVEVHLAGRGPTEDRVEVGAVIVQEAARGMDDIGDLEDMLFEDPEGVRIREHEREGLVPRRGPEGLQIDPAVLRRNLDDVVPEHARGREVRPVGGVGQDDLVARLPSVAMIRGGDEETRVFPLSPGRGLQRDRVHAGDFRQDPLQFVEEAQRPLDRGLVLVRMDPRDGREGGELFRELRVELHRARSERIESRVDSEVHLR